jgi:hypothetical protein
MTTANTGTTSASSCMALPGWEVVAVATARPCSAGGCVGLVYYAAPIDSTKDEYEPSSSKPGAADPCLLRFFELIAYVVLANCVLLQVLGVLEEPPLAHHALLAPRPHLMRRPPLLAIAQCACLDGAALLSCQPFQTATTMLCALLAIMGRIHLAEPTLALLALMGE